MKQMVQNRSLVCRRRLRSLSKSSVSAKALSNAFQLAILCLHLHFLTITAVTRRHLQRSVEQGHRRSNAFSLSDDEYRVSYNLGNTPPIERDETSEKTNSDKSITSDKRVNLHRISPPKHPPHAEATTQSHDYGASSAAISQTSRDYILARNIGDDASFPTVIDQNTYYYLCLDTLVPSSGNLLTQSDYANFMSVEAFVELPWEVQYTFVNSVCKGKKECLQTLNFQTDVENQIGFEVSGKQGKKMMESICWNSYIGALDYGLGPFDDSAVAPTEEKSLSYFPSIFPTVVNTEFPSSSPTVAPTKLPSDFPTVIITESPSDFPTVLPTEPSVTGEPTITVDDKVILSNAPSSILMMTSIGSPQTGNPTSIALDTVQPSTSLPFFPFTTSPTMMLNESALSFIISTNITNDLVPNKTAPTVTVASHELNFEPTPSPFTSTLMPTTVSPPLMTSFAFVVETRILLVDDGKKDLLNDVYQEIIFLLAERQDPLNGHREIIESVILEFLSVDLVNCTSLVALPSDNERDVFQPRLVIRSAPSSSCLYVVATLSPLTSTYTEQHFHDILSKSMSPYSTYLQDAVPGASRIEFISSSISDFPFTSSPINEAATFPDIASDMFLNNATIQTHSFYSLPLIASSVGAFLLLAAACFTYKQRRQHISTRLALPFLKSTNKLSNTPLYDLENDDFELLDARICVEKADSLSIASRNSRETSSTMYCPDGNVIPQFRPNKLAAITSAEPVSSSPSTGNRPPLPLYNNITTKSSLSSSVRPSHQNLPAGEKQMMSLMPARATRRPSFSSSSLSSRSLSIQSVIIAVEGNDWKAVRKGAERIAIDGSELSSLSNFSTVYSESSDEWSSSDCTPIPPPMSNNPKSLLQGDMDNFKELEEEGNIDDTLLFRAIVDARRSNVKAKSMSAKSTTKSKCSRSQNRIRDMDALIDAGDWDAVAKQAAIYESESSLNSESVKSGLSSLLSMGNKFKLLEKLSPGSLSDSVSKVMKSQDSGGDLFTKLRHTPEASENSDQNKASQASPSIRSVKEKLLEPLPNIYISPEGSPQGNPVCENIRNNNAMLLSPRQLMQRLQAGEHVSASPACKNVSLWYSDESYSSNSLSHDAYFVRAQSLQQQQQQEQNVLKWKKIRKFFGRRTASSSSADMEEGRYPIQHQLSASKLALEDDHSVSDSSVSSARFGLDESSHHLSLLAVSIGEEGTEIVRTPPSTQDKNPALYSQYRSHEMSSMSSSETENIIQSNVGKKSKRIDSTCFSPVPIHGQISPILARGRLTSLRSSESVSSRSSATSMEDELDWAIERGDWAKVQSHADRIATDARGSTKSKLNNEDYLGSVTNKRDCATIGANSIKSNEDARINELERMIRADDWKAVTDLADNGHSFDNSNDFINTSNGEKRE